MAKESVATDPRPAGEGLLAQLEAAERANALWRPSHKSEMPRDTFNRKLHQAEMLSLTLYGGGFDAFAETHDRIQEGVLWLLSDLITEAREALEESEAEARAKQ